jgi:hypothetical protein
MHTMLITWSVVLGGALGAGAWHAMKVGSGNYDLIIDEMNGTLQLPLTLGRKERRQISMGEVESIYVETVQAPSKQGERSSPHYVPTLRLKKGAGEGERLAEWYDSEKAEQFVDWLRAKLPRKTQIANRVQANPLLRGQAG